MAYLDNNGLLYLWNKIKSTFVKQVSGKGLSTNDYTTAEKDKLKGIEDEANKYIHPTNDGNKHVPATGTTNNGKFLMAGSTAGALSWGTPADTTYNDFQGATSSEAGTHGLVPAPAAGSQSTKYLKADGTWQTPPDTKYTHPSGDGNLHVPATGTANGGKVLKAGSTAGSLSWGTLTKADVGLGNTANGAEVNQNDFSNIKVGSTTVAADTKTDTLELVAGSNVTLTPDATNDKVTIAAKDTTYNDFAPPTRDAVGKRGLVPEPPVNGLDKFLMGKGWERIGVDVEASNDYAYIRLLNYTSDDSIVELSSKHFPMSTDAQAGLISAGDKKRLDTMETYANNYTHPVYPSKSSGLYKVTIDSTGHVSATANVTKSDITGLGIPAQDTTYADMKGATSSAAGTHGLVPAPAAGSQSTKYLRADGTWQTPPDTKYTHPTTAGYKHIPTGGQIGQILNWKSSGEAQWVDAYYSIAADVVHPPQTKAVWQFVNDTLVDYAKKSDITGMYKYKGSVADATKLPTTGQKTGDVYNIETASAYGGAGMNVAWDGTKWDPLGEIFTITSITNAEIDTICV